MVIKLRSQWYKRSTEVVFYDSIAELPITNYHEFQKLSLIDLGIGSTMKSFNQHITKLHAYITQDKKSHAIIELQNMLRGYHSCIQKYNSYSFCILPFIKSVGGNRYTLGDLDKCKEDIEFLSERGLTTEKLDDLLVEVKKNSLSHWQQHFLVDLMVPVNQMLAQKYKDRQNFTQI